MLEQGAPLFKPHYGYVSFAALFLFSSLKVVSRLRMWGWQGKEDFLKQEQKTSDYVLWQWTSSHPVVSLGRAARQAGGRRWVTCQLWPGPSCPCPPYDGPCLLVA